jgi:hypothetical protein
MRRLPILLALLLGCATFRSDQTVCPEYRSLRCASAPECSMDRQRGCMVCQCGPGRYVPPEALPPGGGPPVQR